MYKDVYSDEYDIKIKEIIQNTKTNQQGQVKFMKWIHLYGSHI